MRLTIFVVSSFMVINAISQLQTTIIEPDAIEGKDAFVYSANPTYSYNSQIYHHVYATASGGAKIRTYTQYNIENYIPDNAVIVNAELEMSLYNNITYGVADIKFSMVDEVWNENSITWSNQPTTWTSGDLVFSGQSTSVQNFDVTDHVKKWVEQKYPNHGWQISLDNEAPTSTKGYLFTSTDRTVFNPKLTITYYLPIDFDGVTTHCTSGNSDGEITLNSFTGGSGNFSYSWYNSSGVSLSNSTATIVNLSPGAYIAKVQDNSCSDCYRLKYFLVGEECEETTISLQLQEDLTDDIISANNNPYGNSETYYATYAGEMYGQVFSSYMRYEFGGVSNVTPISADLVLKRHYHIGFSSGDQLFFERKDFYWNERTATYSWFAANETSTVSSYEFSQGPINTWTVDLSDALRDHFQDQANMFNFKFTLLDNAPLASNNAYGVKSSNNSNSIRPILKVTFTPNSNCSFNPLEKRVSSRLIDLEGDILKISYIENYAIQSGNKLDYKIYDVSRNVIAGAENGVALVTNSPIVEHFEGYTEESLDFSSLNLPSGYYCLEVYLEKNETRYLKIKIN